MRCNGRKLQLVLTKDITYQDKKLVGMLRKLFKVSSEDFKNRPKTHLRLTVSFLRRFGAWPEHGRNESLQYKAFNIIVLSVLSLHGISLTLDIFEATKDLDRFFDDLCLWIGVYLVLFKVFSFQILCPDIRRFITIFDDYTDESSYTDPDLRQKIDMYFIQDHWLLYSNIVLGVVLSISLCAPPFFIEGHMLPFRAFFPFSTDNPIGYWGAYMFQSLCTFTNIQLIVYVDNVGVQFLNQTALQFELFCHRFRQFGRRSMDPGNLKTDLGTIVKHHQGLISLVDEINISFRPMFLAQVIASMSIICLTAFEASLTIESTSYLFKFVCYMFSAFMQLLYWCWAGNKASQKSVDVADAAYNCEWLNVPPQMKRDIRFILMRAQKPVSFNAKPLYVLNFDSFISILSGSYSYFTLLRSLNN